MAYDDRETGLTVEDRGSKLGLPQNQDAEANVLAAMLLSPEVVEEAQVELQPDDFYRPIHKTIYTAMVDMYNSRIPIDSISLIDYLRSINKLDAVGGEAYILELMGQTLSLVNWQHHAAIVRRDSMLRELIGATNEINALAYNAPTDTKEVVELADVLGYDIYWGPRKGDAFVGRGGAAERVSFAACGETKDTELVTTRRREIPFGGCLHCNAMCSI